MGDRAFAHHVTMRLESSQVIAGTVGARRCVARVFHEEGEARGLLAFRLADTHAHALVLGTRRDAGMLARYVELRLRWHLRLRSRFEPARFVPIETQRHLERAFLYLLRQEQHHGIDLDPMHEASSAPDFVGLRVIGPGLVRRTHEALPRVRREDVLSAMSLERCEPTFDRLADAAAAACALADLTGRCDRTSTALTAAVHAAPELKSADLAARLGVTRRSVNRCRSRQGDAATIAAVRLQLTLRPSPRA